MRLYEREAPASVESPWVITVSFSSQVVLAPAQIQPKETHVPQTQESPETAASSQTQTQPLTCPQVRLILVPYESEL